MLLSINSKHSIQFSASFLHCLNIQEYYGPHVQFNFSWVVPSSELKQNMLSVVGHLCVIIMLSVALLYISFVRLCQKNKSGPLFHFPPQIFIQHVLPTLFDLHHLRTRRTILYCSSLCLLLRICSTAFRIPHLLSMQAVTSAGICGSLAFLCALVAHGWLAFEPNVAFFIFVSFTSVFFDI